MAIGFIRKLTNRDTLVDDTDNPLPTAVFSAGSAINFNPPSLIDAYLRTIKRLTPYKLDQNTAADFTIQNAVALQTIRIRRFHFLTVASNTISILDGSTVLDSFPITGAGGYSSDSLGGLVEPLYVTSINSALKVRFSAAVQTYGLFEYDVGVP